MYQKKKPRKQTPPGLIVHVNETNPYLGGAPIAPVNGALDPYRSNSTRASGFLDVHFIMTTPIPPARSPRGAGICHHPRQHCK
jgi:hypothetical protein